MHRRHHTTTQGTASKGANQMTKLHRLYAEYGQSAWLDNLTRGYLTGGELARLIDAGIRGVTSNPTIFAKAMSSSEDYDAQFRTLSEGGMSTTDAYWTMAVDDIRDALTLLRPLYDQTGGQDGFVSVELSPDLARDTAGSIEAARALHARIDEPNLFVKIPATAEGVPAIRRMIAEGRSTNITLIFSLGRYDDVLEAYLDGLEELARNEPGRELSDVHSVASFFVSRVDTEVDRRLEAIGGGQALQLRGQAAVAQAQLAYEMFRRRFSGARWEALAARGARVQRPLWASTSTKNPTYPKTLYVDALIGPDTVNTLPESTIDAFEQQGTLARTIDAGIEQARDTLRQLESAGIDLTDVGDTLEREGVAIFTKSFDDVLASLDAKRSQLTGQRDAAAPGV
jgi:transaldolase